MTAQGANPGRGSYEMAARVDEMIFAARERIVGFFAVPSPERVIFTPGCTWAINCVLKGVLRPGDHVITSDLEHNAVVRPLHSLEKRGVSVSQAHVCEGDDDATLQSFCRLINRRTKLIFCTHASNVLGIRLPVERLSALCREHGLLFGLDCAQTAGVAPLDLDRVPCDFLCMPAHKGLYGLTGCGLLLLGGDTIPEPLCEGGTGSMSALRDMPDALPDRLEPGTLNVPGIAALGAGVEAVAHVGREKIFLHELELMRQLYDGLCEMDGVCLYTRRPDAAHHVPLLSFNIGAYPSEEAAALLARRGIAVRAGFHCAYSAHEAVGTARRGTVRVCPSMFTTMRDIDALLGAIRGIL